MMSISFSIPIFIVCRDSCDLCPSSRSTTLCLVLCGLMFLLMNGIKSFSNHRSKITDLIHPVSVNWTLQEIGADSTSILLTRLPG